MLHRCGVKASEAGFIDLGKIIQIENECGLKHNYI